MKDSQQIGGHTVSGKSISKANNERFSTENIGGCDPNKYIKGE